MIKRKTARITKAQQEQLEREWREHNQRLKQMGVAKETFKQFIEWVYGRSKTVAQQTDMQQYKKSHTKIQSAATDSGSAYHSCIAIRDKFVIDITSDKGKSKSTEPTLAIEPPGFSVRGACSSKPSPVYTGTKIIGVAIMHKSNSVPIFSDTEAKEISSMRR